MTLPLSGGCVPSHLVHMMLRMEPRPGACWESALPAEPQPQSRKMARASAYVVTMGDTATLVDTACGDSWPCVLVGQPGLPPGTLMVVALPDTQLILQGRLYSLLYSPHYWA